MMGLWNIKNKNKLKKLKTQWSFMEKKSNNVVRSCCTTVQGSKGGVTFACQASVGGRCPFYSNQLSGWVLPNWGLACLVWDL